MTPLFTDCPLMCGGYLPTIGGYFVSTGSTYDRKPSNVVLNCTVTYLSSKTNYNTRNLCNIL